MIETGSRVTVSVAVHDGMRWLEACLDSVVEQSHSDLEILIIDDASTDGSLDWLRQRARSDHRIHVDSTSTNIGYASAQNRNIRRASGSAILLLNQDVVLDRDFVGTALAVLVARPRVASVQGRLLRLAGDGTRTNTLDSTGMLMYRDRHAVIRDHLRPDGSGSSGTAGPVWGADGPAPLIRSAALRSARLPASSGGWEVLDEDFFMYKEDVDLAWRLQRLGWEAWYEPAAVGWHVRTRVGFEERSPRSMAAANLANSPRIRRLSYRNQRLMQIKNDPLGQALRDLPLLAARELVEFAYLALRDRTRLAVLPSLVRGLPWAMRKRIALSQALRRRP